jgi:predicted tellurium resistance membrane protein TerC
MVVLLTDPSTWLAWITLTGLEVVLGVDNLVVLSMLVSRMPAEQQTLARLGGLTLAMGTRVALLFSVVWLTGLNAPWARLGEFDLTGRRCALIVGGIFLLIKGVSEIHVAVEDAVSPRGSHTPRPLLGSVGVWVGMLQIALIDIVFSLDSVFTAVGFAQRIEVMIAAIVTAMLGMLWMSGFVVKAITERPTIKLLALAFLIVIGVTLLADAFDHPIPKGYLYFSMAMVALVEWINQRVRSRSQSPKA